MEKVMLILNFLFSNSVYKYVYLKQMKKAEFFAITKIKCFITSYNNFNNIYTCSKIKKILIFQN